MSDAHEIFGAVADTVDANTSDDGIDMINVYIMLIDAFKESPDMTIERWETLRLSINNSVQIFNHLIDEELEKLRLAEEE